MTDETIQTPQDTSGAGESVVKAPTPAPTPDNILSGGTPEPTDNLAPVAPRWPDDWQKLAAGGDETVEKRLGRYASPTDALQALIHAQNKISSGLKPSQLPKDATPEQVAQWRQENGIPESPDRYEVKIPENIRLTDEDKEVMNDFLKAAHGSNLRPDQANAVLSWMLERQEATQAETAKKELEYRRTAEDELRAEWGNQYRMNVGLAASFLESAPAEVQQALAGARLADGTPLGNSPGVLRWFANMARELNPAATVVPGAGSDSMSAIENRIRDIKAMIADKEKSNAYFKNEALQQEFRDLLEAQARLQKKQGWA